MPLHPFCVALLERLAALPGLSSGSVDAARAMVAAGRPALGAGPDMAEVRDLVVPTRSGSVRARLLVPHGTSRGAVVYLHGGGWAIGTIEDFDTLARKLAAASGCAVLLPDYRLAPEHPFPAGLEDCEDVLVWAAAQPLPDGVKRPLVVAGDSAGANLATVAARRLGGRVELALHVLIYPVADCDFSTASYAENGVGLTLTTADMKWFFDHYAPPDRTHPDVSPLRATDLSGMPPAVVVTAEYDVLADEGAAYAERLRQEGVPVAFRQVAGLMHGFIRLHNLVDAANAAVEAIAADIAAACADATSDR